MPNLGLAELIVILMIVVLVFGASRLPQLGESVGKTISRFKRGLAQNEGIQVSAPKKQAGAGTQRDAGDPNVSDAEVVEDAETKKS